MKLGLRKGEKGFTLVELMVVMAIMAILASVVVPAVSGTKQVSQNSQVQQDGSAVETAVGNFNSNANIAEMFTTDNETAVVGESALQTISSRWPEDKLTDVYSSEFPASAGSETGEVASVTIQDFDGTTIYEKGGATGVALGDFAGDYTAVDVESLITAGYLTEEPRSYDTVFSATQPYHSFLWMLEKITTEEGTQTGRVVAVFRLTQISGSAGDELMYKRVY
jgi:prepilin-type N-terminal cleavage/methylation domain-containing protein